jgi:glycosyltransferase involved in cell wall biosynthesis
MAVRNGGDFLEASIASIAAQTFGDWEMIVVDDASTDGTRARLESWCRRDARIKLLAHDRNRGQTPSLNEGLRACRGTWVARQDADDLSAPERLSRQVGYLRRHPGTVLLGTAGVLIDGADRRVGLLDVPLDPAGVAWCSPFLNPFLHTSVVFHRTTIAEDSGGYDEDFRIAQDYELWTRVAAEHVTANLPERLIRYRRTPSSLSRAGEGLAYAEADRVSAREAKRVFGRSWSEDEERVTAAFRRGVVADEFPAMRRRWAAEFRQRHPQWSRGPASMEAAWRLRMAGAANGKMAAAVRLLGAWLFDPRFTSSWIVDRWLR